MFIDGTTATGPALARTILMTADATGGVLTYALSLASELAKGGTKVHLALMGPKARPEQEARARAISGLVLHENAHALEWMDDPWPEVARAGSWLRDLERQVRPDIIHLNAYCHGAAGFAAPVVIVAHECLLSRWEALEGSATPPERYAAYREGVKRGLGTAAAVVAVSQSMRTALDRHYGPLARLGVVPSGLSVETNGAKKEPFIVSSGRLWDRAKDVELLVRAAGELPWPVKLAGGPAPRGVGDGVVPGAHEKVENVGWLAPKDLGSLLDRAGIYVEPARYAPFGMSALEAGLRGCALVLADLPSLRELWTDAAIFFPPGDAKALVQAVTKVTRDDAERKRLADAAHLRASLYTPARMGRAMRDLYETMIQARRAPSQIVRGPDARPL